MHFVSASMKAKQRNSTINSRAQQNIIDMHAYFIERFGMDHLLNWLA